MSSITHIDTANRKEQEELRQSLKENIRIWYSAMENQCLHEAEAHDLLNEFVTDLEKYFTCEDYWLPEAEEEEEL